MLLLHSFADTRHATRLQDEPLFILSFMDVIKKYFPQLTDEQEWQFAALGGLYADWNGKINVISRKDIGNLYEHHVLHSLAIARMVSFTPGTRVLDVGTGGGFPGIPLAILFPEARFTLIDSTRKKIMVGTEVAKAIGLRNVELKHLRVEEEKESYHFVVSRGVMPLAELVKLARKNIAAQQQNALPNGIICLKGGELQHEIEPFRKTAEVFDIQSHFKEEYFKTKKIVYVPL